MKKMFLAALLATSFTFAAPVAFAGTTNVYPSGGNGQWWVYRWGSTSGLVQRAKDEIEDYLDCSGQGNCAAVANEVYRAHFNIRSGPGSHAAHAFVDCQAMNAPVPDGHILILSCGDSNISWNICPIHVQQNR